MLLACPKATPSLGTLQTRLFCLSFVLYYVLIHLPHQTFVLHALSVNSTQWRVAVKILFYQALTAQIYCKKGTEYPMRLGTWV